MGSLLEEVTFGVLDDEAARAESQKIHNQLANILRRHDRHEVDFAEILVALHTQTDVHKTIKKRLQAIEQSLRDNSDSPFPEFFGNAVEKVLAGNDEIHAEIQKLAEQQKFDHEKQTQDHKRHDQKLDVIIDKIDDLKPCYDVSPPGTIHNIPHNSLGDLFKGRQEDFQKLIQQIDDPSNTTAITQAIQGLGGVGKTRLAIEYGWHALQQGIYNAVFFVNCSQELTPKEKPANLTDQQSRQISAFDRLCVEMAKLTASHLLNIPVMDPTDHQRAFQAVLKEIQNRDKWLIVFDNVDEPAMAHAVSAILPQLHNGNTIITSRLTNFAENIKPLKLEKLTPEASIEYLLAKTAGKRPSRANDQEKVKELADILDGLPVALEQAAAYINYQTISFEDYLHKFNALDKKLLEFDAHAVGLGQYTKPVLGV